MNRDGARFTNSKPTVARSRKPGPGVTNSRARFTNSKPAATAGNANQRQKRPPKKQKQAAATTSKATAAIPHRRMAVAESKARPALDLRGQSDMPRFQGMCSASRTDDLHRTPGPVPRRLWLAYFIYRVDSRMTPAAER